MIIRSHAYCNFFKSSTIFKFGKPPGVPKDQGGQESLQGPRIHSTKSKRSTVDSSIWYVVPKFLAQDRFM